MTYVSGAKSWEKTKKQVETHGRQIGEMTQLMNAISLVVVLMTAALVVTVLGLFIDVWQSKTQAYNDLQKEIQKSRGHSVYYHGQF